MSAEQKRAIVMALDNAVSAGVSMTVACQVLQISRQRVYRWKHRAGDPAHALADPLTNRPPGPASGQAPHRLLVEEKTLIATLAREEAHADLSLRQLAVVASEQGYVQVSAASFYRYAPVSRREADRLEKTPMHQTKPVVEPAGPKQITYDWLRFQDALTFHELEEVIATFIDYRHRHRYHGAIGFVTPQQKHTGQDGQILQARQKRKEAARQRRLAVHRQQTAPATDLEAA